MVKISQIPGLKLSQNIALTPQLIQAIKLFELNNIELENYLNKEIIDNPFLEKDGEANEEDFEENFVAENETNQMSIEDEIQISNKENPIDDQTNIFDVNHNDVNHSTEGSEITNFLEETLSYKKSLNESLIDQVNLNFRDDLDKKVAFLLIEKLENNGYLKISIPEFSSDINISEDNVYKVLSKLKKFEPVGIFSQSLEECILSQLEEMQMISKPIVNLVNNLEILATGNIKKLSKICEADENEIFKMLKIIRRCNPRPLTLYDEYVDDIKEPDVIVKKYKSKWVVELNENTLPRVLVNTGYYEELASKNLSKEDKNYLSSRYASGKWILKALEQRAATILRVSREIVKQQNLFLDKGLAYMKPMILKDIAMELNLHESTISRITNSKEIDTPRGIYSLKFFFSKAISNKGSEDISSQVVKTKIKELIDNETLKTLSDIKLKNLLVDNGIKIARRTITKYREEMHIPSSFERKKLKRLEI